MEYTVDCGVTIT